MKLQILITATLLFITGCVQQQPVIQEVKVVKKKTKKHYAPPPPPKKKIELKEVEDENFSSEYMYPETKKKSTEVKKIETAATPVASGMSKNECITMIGQEKFDRYAQMYGGESASLKKCKMLKAL